QQGLVEQQVAAHHPGHFSQLTTQLQAVVEPLDGLRITASLEGAIAQQVERLDLHEVGGDLVPLVQRQAVAGQRLGVYPVAGRLFDDGQVVQGSRQIDE